MSGCPVCGDFLRQVNPESLLCENCNKMYDIDDTDVLE